MKTERFSETTASTYKSTRRQNPRRYQHDNNSRENLNSFNVVYNLNRLSPSYDILIVRSKIWNWFKMKKRCMQIPINTRTVKLKLADRPSIRICYVWETGNSRGKWKSYMNHYVLWERLNNRLCPASDPSRDSLCSYKRSWMELKSCGLNLTGLNPFINIV